MESEHIRRGCIISLAAKQTVCEFLIACRTQTFFKSCTMDRARSIGEIEINDEDCYQREHERDFSVSIYLVQF